MTTAWKIASYCMRDLLRSRWLIGYAAFLVVATGLLLRFSDSDVKALLSLSSVVLMLVPLANVVFGAMYLYSAREFVELLLAQPIRRPHIYHGLYVGLTVPIVVVTMLGIMVPLLLSGVAHETLLTGLVLAVTAGLLAAVFTAIAGLIAYTVEDRVRGLTAAIAAWLGVAVVYDALVLTATVQLADYPLEWPLLVAMLANPIDLARIVLLQQFDTAALLGYTGAVFQRYLSGAAGLFVATGAVVLWVGLPVLSGARLFQRKDF